MENINDIKNLIAKDELSQAMQQILLNVKKVKIGRFNDAIILSMDLCSFKKEKRKGTLSPDELDRRKRIVAYRMLEFLDKRN